MQVAGAAKGQAAAWNLIHKLGEGDAGEVYLVTSARDGRQAILKRPRLSAFHAEVLRQASQIRSEADILRALKGFRTRLETSYLSVPQLLDRAKPEMEDSAEYFMVIEKAPGFDLDFLFKLNHIEQNVLEQHRQSVSPQAYYFMEQIRAQQTVPESVILKCLEAVIILFEEIHHYPGELDGVEKGGILWNDVKPEHIFWDPVNRQCTVIDWGNAQFLEMDGATRDRMHSAPDDYIQFLDSIGKFLQNSRPELYAQLGWPEGSFTPETSFKEVRSICEKVEQRLASLQAQALKLHERETDLLNSANPRTAQIEELDKLHQQLFAAGESPAYEGAGAFAAQLAKSLIAEENLVEFAHLAQWANNLPLEDHNHWQLLSTLSQIGLSSSEESQPAFLFAVNACMQDNTAEVLWDLLRETGSGSIPDWYPALSRLIRNMQLDLEPEQTTPLEDITRFAAALENHLRAENMPADETYTLFERTTGFIGMNEKNRKMMAWFDRLNSEIIPRWQQLEPDPPQAGLAYNDIHAFIGEIEAVFPDAGQFLSRTIYQPEAQISIILDAWDRKDFDFAMRVLRRLLAWDPERQRIINAGMMMDAVPKWLKQLDEGPNDTESLEDFATRHEVFARDLRSRVGRSQWLERLLQAFKSLRQGKSLSEVVSENPGVAAELPWMNRAFHTFQQESYETAYQAAAREDYPSVYELERKHKNNVSAQLYKGLKETTYGPDGDILLGEPLDTWRPEAQGSSARVFQGFVRNGEDSLKQRAIKIMRHNQRDYALPLFEEEIRIMRIMQNYPGMTPVFEFGFLKPENDDLDEEIFSTAPEMQKGTLLRYGWDQADAYLEEIQERTLEGWLPYLVMEKKNPETNLLTLCDGGYTQGNLLPVKLGLLIAIQICDILSLAHRNNILYRDHKILHYYWQPVYNGVFVIDWNVAKIFDRELTESERNFDLVQFGARALHHILSGRPAPGALPLGPTRPDEIEQASTQYNVSWSFDDQRLSEQVKAVMEKTLAGTYSRVETLQYDLLEVYHRTGDE